MSDFVWHGTYIPLSGPMAEDIRLFQEFRDGVMDRLRRPWAYPDRPAVRNIDPFPRWTRLCERATEVRVRALGAWDVLRLGVPSEFD